ncbi:MAG: serine hydrolase [Bacteroidota bacterium]
MKSFFKLLTSLLIVSLQSLSIQGQHLPEIDRYIKQMQARYEIPGIALAIIKEGEIIHQQTYGYANLEHQVPIKDQSLFRLYSISKVFASVALFQLIEAGKLTLEDPISLFLPDLPEKWAPIKIKHLLSYSSGLADMAQPYLEIRDLSEDSLRERVFAANFQYDTGERFEYSQTNFWLVQKLIEKISDQDISSLIKQQFPDPKDSIFFSSDAREIILHRTTSYFPYATGSLGIDHPYYQGTYSYAMNGLHLSLRDFIAWDKNLRKDQLLQLETKQKMWEAFPYRDSSSHFAYGWGIYDLPGHRSYGFSGSGCTMYRHFPEKNLSIIFLSNGFGRFYNLGACINYLAYLSDEDLVDPETVFFEESLKIWSSDNGENPVNAYRELKGKISLSPGNLESVNNALGYYFLRQGEIKLALSIFKLNTEEFPTSWNVYDSYGEALLLNGAETEALKMYQKSLNLNPENEQAKITIDRILSK